MKFNIKSRQFFLECSHLAHLHSKKSNISWPSYKLLTALLAEIWIIIQSELFTQTDGQTDRNRRIGAHRVNCTGGLKNCTGGLKVNKNEDPLEVLLGTFVNKPSFKHLYHVLFWRMVHRCKKCSDIWKVPSGGWAEIKKPKVYHFFTFWISALPPEGVFVLWLNVFHLWTVLQKKYIQIFERWLINKIIKQNVKRVLNFSS